MDNVASRAICDKLRCMIDYDITQIVGRQLYAELVLE